MRVVSRKSMAGLIAAVFAVACVGLGSWGFHKSSERGVNVTLTATTKFQNGETLPAGTYRMQVEENSQAPKVTFYKEDPSTQDWGGHAMASINVKAITEPEKNQQTEVDSVTHGNTQTLKTVRPRGWNEELIFGSNGGGASKKS